MNKLAIIHTTAVTIPLLKELASEILPVALLHWLDDSILSQLREGMRRPSRPWQTNGPPMPGMRKKRGRMYTVCLFLRWRHRRAGRWNGQRACGSH